MRSFAEMPVWLLALFIAMFVVMLVGLVGGLAIAHLSKKNIDKAFGLFTLVISMFVSIPVFLVGLITTIPAEAAADAGVGILNMITEIVVWGSLLPLVLTPLLIVHFLMVQFHETPKVRSNTAMGRLSNFVSIHERWRNPVQSLRSPRLVR